MKARVRAAVVQAASVVFNRERSIQKLSDLTADAARQGAELVLFPEAFVAGYPKGLDFGARIGSRTPAGREQFRIYLESAVTVPGPDVDRMAQAARQAGVVLVVGVIERDGGTLYCTALTFAPTGVLLGKHRKLMPTASERVVWGMGDGSTLPVFDTALGRLGSVICWENYMPMLRLAMFAQGIELYCAPTADSRPTWLASMQHIALEGRCFVLSCCQYLRRSDCPPGYPAATNPELASAHDGADAPLMSGGSCIIGPLGEVLAGPNHAGEAILLADLEGAAIARGKLDFDVAGHYARPDIFELRVNTRPQQAVRFDAHDPHTEINAPDPSSV